MIGKRIPVEPLPERSRARLERAVLEAVAAQPAAVEPAPPARPAAGWWRVAAVGGFAVAAALAAILVRSGGDTPPVAAPTRVVTEGAPTRVSVGEATLEVSAASALVATGDDTSGVLVVLERGRVSCSVPPRRGRPPFAVQAGAVRVEVVGTRFAVARDGEAATVEVEEGTVRVVAGGQVTLVHAGERWPARAAAAAPEELPPAPAASPASPEPEIVIADDDLIARAKKRAAPVPARPTVDAQGMYEQAARLERVEPRRAVEIYLDVARGGGAWAAPALFAAGRLSLERGDADLGRRLLERYLAEYPGGANAADARRLLGR